VAQDTTSQNPTSQNSPALAAGMLTSPTKKTEGQGTLGMATPPADSCKKPRIIRILSTLTYKHALQLNAAHAVLHILQ
jgi:hypothetical protein